MARLLGFDALRGVAALLALLFHLQMRYRTGGPWTLGSLAVDLFFVLSGYVMARTYEARLAGGLSLGSFVSARYRRLWLPYAVGCTLGLAFALTSTGSPYLAWHLLASWLLGLLFLPTPFMGVGVFALNTPGWTLFFELIANMLHALVLSRLGTRVLALVWLAAALVLWALAQDAGWLQAGTKLAFWPLGAMRTLVSYVAGVLLWRLVRDRALLPLPWWAALAAMPALILAGKHMGQPLFQLGFVLLACPLLTILALRFDPPAMVRPVAEWLGALSYPLYAVHMPVIQLCQRFEQPWAVALAATLLAGWAVTALAARWPVLRAWFSGARAVRALR